MRTTWILVFEGTLSLGCKTSRILVLRTLKIPLQNDGLVSVFKSSYPSWRPVLKTGLQGIFKMHFCPLGFVEMTTFGATGDDKIVALTTFSCMCCGHSTHAILRVSRYGVCMLFFWPISDRGYYNSFHEWNWSNMYIDNLVQDCGISSASAVVMPWSCTEPSMCAIKHL